MKDKIKITWEADDGYAGGSAPQHVSIPVEEITECENEEEAMRVVRDAIQYDFETKVCATYDEDEIRAIIHKARGATK